MATNNGDILQRLNRARASKPKKAYEGPKAVSDKKKAQMEADKAAGIKPEPRKHLARGGKPKGRSERMRGIIAALRPLYNAFMKDKEACEIISPACTGRAECVHHTEGRYKGHPRSIQMEGRLLRLQLLCGGEGRRGQGERS